jgi:hypothetical protein
MKSQQYEYYDELLEKSSTSLKTLDIGEVALSFNRKLKMLPPELYKEASSWLYALIAIHNLKNGNADVLFPYNPKVVDTQKDEYFCSYNIAKIPSRELQGILVCYMMECINAI